MKLRTIISKEDKLKSQRLKDDITLLNTRCTHEDQKEAVQKKVAELEAEIERLEKGYRPVARV